jgi:hypothetical protein
MHLSAMPSISLGKILSVVILLFFLSATTGKTAEHGTFTQVEGIATMPGGPALIKGRILNDDGEPMTGGRVSFFAVDIGPPSRQSALRRVPEAIAPVSAEGAFSIRLPEGRYYVGAMSREFSEGPGPPVAGEKALSAGTKDNAPLIVEIKGDQESELAPITMRAGVKFPEHTEFFTVTGAITDAKGKPFAGAYIFIKIDANSQRPNFISPETGKDGRFKLQLPAGKSYHLFAKDTVNFGKPAAGKHIGAYNGPDRKFSIIPAPAPVTGQKGDKLTGIDIIMHEAADPESQKAGNQEDRATPGENGPRLLQRPNLPGKD